MKTPSKDDIADIMKSSPVYKLGGKKGKDANTFDRRSSNVYVWCRWCFSIIDEDKF